jgi:hypothetical protein
MQQMTKSSQQRITTGRSTKQLDSLSIQKAWAMMNNDTVTYLLLVMKDRPKRKNTVEQQSVLQIRSKKV